MASYVKSEVPAIVMWLWCHCWAALHFCCTQSFKKHDFFFSQLLKEICLHFMENVLKHYHLHIMLSRALKEALLVRKMKKKWFCVQNKWIGVHPWHHSHMTLIAILNVHGTPYCITYQHSNACNFFISQSSNFIQTFTDL